jgi:small GTP-binding protein
MLKISKTMKFVIVGSSATGKTSILKRYFEDGFSHGTLSTIGIDFKVKRIRVPNGTNGTNGSEYRIQVWDTAGLESNRCISTNFYRNSSGVILVYDVSDRSSFDAIASMNGWMRDIRDNCDEGTIVYLVGNKTDTRYLDSSSAPSMTLQRPLGSRDVTTVELKKFAELHECPYYECSAKYDIGVTKIFEDLIAQTLAKDGLRSPKDLSSPVILKPEDEAKTAGPSTRCCK